MLLYECSHKLLLTRGWRIQVKKKQSKTGKPLSMGFGFVEFDGVDTAKSVCQTLQVRLVLVLIVLVRFVCLLPQQIISLVERVGIENSVRIILING